jgi:hypothetical protein
MTPNHRNTDTLSGRTLVFAVLVAGVLTMPEFLRLPGFRIDNDWLVAVNMGLWRGMQFGKDIIFNYGPLGFLWAPMLCYFKLWLIAAVFALLVHVLLIYLMLSLARKSSAAWWQYALAGTAIALSIWKVPLDYRLAMCSTILLYMAGTGWFTKKGSAITAVTLASLLLAVASLVKFTAVIVSGLTLAAALLVFAYRREAARAACAVAAYVVSVLALWLAAGQHIDTLPAFVRNSWQISSGYMASMQLWTNSGYVSLSAAAVMVWLAMLACAVMKKRTEPAAFLLLGLGFVVVAFKLGAVRSDHIFDALADLLLIFAILVLVLKRHTAEAPSIVQAAALTCLAALTLVGVRNIPLATSGISRNISVLGGGFVRQYFIDTSATIDAARAELGRGYGLTDSTLKFMGSRSVDAFSVSTALVYAYDLNWSPRPVFESYAANTLSLDAINAEHLESPDGPQVLLADLFTIDHRNPLFDEPATMRTLLANYDARFRDHRFVVFERRAQPVRFSERHIAHTEAPLGTEVRVPQTAGPVYGRIFVDSSLPGRAAGLVYKTPPLEIRLRPGEGEPFRFVGSNAANGILLSGVERFTISTACKACYEQPMRVEFFEAVPVDPNERLPRTFPDPPQTQ